MLQKLSLFFLVVIMLLAGCKKSYNLYEIEGGINADVICFPPNGSATISLPYRDEMFFVETNVKFSYNKIGFSKEPLILNLESNTKLNQSYEIKGATFWKTVDNSNSITRMKIDVFFENEQLKINISPASKKLYFNVKDGMVFNQEILVNYDAVTWGQISKDGWQYGYCNINYNYCPVIDSENAHIETHYKYSIPIHTIKIGLRKKIIEELSLI